MGEVGGMVLRKVGAIRMIVFRKHHFVLVNAKIVAKTPLGVQLSATAADGLVARYRSVVFYMSAAVPKWI